MRCGGGCLDGCETPSGTCLSLAQAEGRTRCSLELWTVVSGGLLYLEGRGRDPLRLGWPVTRSVCGEGGPKAVDCNGDGDWQGRTAIANRPVSGQVVVGETCLGCDCLWSTGSSKNWPKRNVPESFPGACRAGQRIGRRLKQWMKEQELVGLADDAVVGGVAEDRWTSRMCSGYRSNLEVLGHKRGNNQTRQESDNCVI